MSAERQEWDRIRKLRWYYKRLPTKARAQRYRPKKIVSRETRKTARQRGYTTRWDRERKRYLLTNPLCVMCKREGIDTLANVVDHITPHKGNPALFWSRTNWQSLCKPHHDGTKKRIEIRGFDSSVNARGEPTDPNHPWFKCKTEN